MDKFISEYSYLIEYIFIHTLSPSIYVYLSVYVLIANMQFSWCMLWHHCNNERKTVSCLVSLWVLEDSRHCSVFLKGWFNSDKESWRSSPPWSQPLRRWILRAMRKLSQLTNWPEWQWFAEGAVVGYKGSFIACPIFLLHMFRMVSSAATFFLFGVRHWFR